MSQLTISPDLWSRLEALVHENAAWPVENHEEIEHTVAELRRLVADQQRLLERKTAREDQLNARVAQLEQYIEQVATQSLRYRELFDCAPDAYLVTDAAGAIEKANHAAAALFRVPRELLLNKPMPFFIVHERRLELYQRLNALIRRQQAISNWEVPMQPRGGLVLTTLVTVTPIVDADGILQGLRWLVRDVSELHQARVRALQLERLAVLGQRAADLAHDGRNLLSRAQAFLQRLTWRLEESGEALDFVKRAMDANNDLVRLFNDVCGYAGPVQLEAAPCDLRQIWRGAWEETAILHPERPGRLIERAEEAHLACHADPLRLWQVFRNLFENAWAACLGEVEITLSASDTQLDGAAAVCISVRDNGPGIRAAERPRVFEPFFTTKKGGTGLGLSITKRIIEAHGGRIEVVNALAGGAEFLITLPRAPS